MTRTLISLVGWICLASLGADIAHAQGNPLPQPWPHGPTSVTGNSSAYQQLPRWDPRTQNPSAIEQQRNGSQQGLNVPTVGDNSRSSTGHLARLPVPEAPRDALVPDPGHGAGDPDAAPLRSANLNGAPFDSPNSGPGWSTFAAWGPQTDSPIQLGLEAADTDIHPASATHWDDGPQNMSLDDSAFLSDTVDDSCCDCISNSMMCGDPSHAFLPTRSTITWLYGDGDHVGITHWALRHSIAAQRMLVTPGIDVRFLDGPRRPDLPPRVYNLFVDLNHEGRISPDWSYQVGLRPTLATDGNRVDSSAIQLGGRFIAFHKYSEFIELALGVYYFDREDVPMLPTFGLIMKPDENTRWNLVFPNPRLSFRFLRADAFDLWTYQGFEFGGGTWAIERADGSEDTFSYRDWRWLVGTELRTQNGRKFFAEFGLVFRRKLEYRSGVGNYTPANTGIVRVGVVW